MQYDRLVSARDPPAHLGSSRYEQLRLDYDPPVGRWWWVGIGGPLLVPLLPLFRMETPFFSSLAARDSALHDVKDLNTVLCGAWGRLGEELSDLVVAARFCGGWGVVSSGTVRPGVACFDCFQSDVTVCCCPRYLFTSVDLFPFDVCGGFDPLGWDASCQDADPFLEPCGRSARTEDKEPAKVKAEKPSVLLGFRLRRRGRETHSLARVALRSGWWRDLPGSTPANAAVSWLSSWSSGEVKVGVPRPITVSAEGESATAVPLLVTGGGGVGQSLWVCPELVASLVCSRALRAVDFGLLQSLRSRARLWAKERGMSDLDLSFVISGSVTFAALPQRQEVAAVSLLRTDAARWSTGVLGALAGGLVKDGMDFGFWESARRILRWRDLSDQLEPSAHSVRLST